MIEIFAYIVSLVEEDQAVMGAWDHMKSGVWISMKKRVNCSMQTPSLKIRPN